MEVQDSEEIADSRGMVERGMLTPWVCVCVSESAYKREFLGMCVHACMHAQVIGNEFLPFRFSRKVPKDFVVHK